MGLIFAEFATSLKSPEIDTAENKPYFTYSLRATSSGTKVRTIVTKVKVAT